jgi:predicted O-linked N-acetylglucosamine transferase (SPINDLY family)
MGFFLLAHRSDSAACRRDAALQQLTIQQSLDLALKLHHAGRLAEAEKLYRQILADQPEHAEAMHHLGVLAHQVGRIDAGVELIRRAISLRPSYTSAYCNLGKILNENGQTDEAAAACRQALTLHPKLPEALNNLGIALTSTGRIDEAIAAFRQAAAFKADYVDAHVNLGVALKDKGLPDEAIAACRRVLVLRPDCAEACNNLGNALKDKGQLDEAIAAYRLAIAIEPHNASFGSNLLFALHAHRAYDARAIAEEHRRWNRQYVEPLRKSVQQRSTNSSQVHDNNRIPQRRLRIGYVSPDFKDHVVGRNLMPLFGEHDRGQFEITCYAQVRSPDAMTGQFQQHADRWRSMIGRSDDQVASQIRADRIDILVDLALHTACNRLLVFARKPAPVQATFAGYPGSTGLSEIDYRLSDPYLDPPGMDESIYSEQTIRLPDSFWCYDPLDCRDISVNPPPALDSGAITFGCLSNFSKINVEVLALWAQVLRQVDNSRMLLLAPQGTHRQQTLDRLRLERIDPRRVEFVANQSRRKYLETYHRIDIGLDSFPYNGHTTSLDSFWMGVPAVTRVGERAVSRAGWCQLSNLGLAELAGKTAEEFVRIAIGLARDLPRLKELRSTLRRRMEQSPLMDAPKFARSIETAYRRMWREWCETA